jgi:hypothetical protein
MTTPGDLVFTHRTAIYSKLITFGQGLRFRGADKKYAHWSHVAVVVGYNGELVEALGRGVVRTNISYYRDVEYHYVGIQCAETDRLQMVNFAEACVGRRYAWVEIPSLGLTLITGAKLVVGNPGTLICSALAAEMLCRGDFIWPREPSTMLPADLAQALRVRL